MNQKLVRPILLLSEMVLLTSLASACPNCATAVHTPESDTGGSAAEGYYYSILFMLAMPYVLLGGFAFAFWRMVRHARSNELPTPVPVR